jgi:YjjG family noncanonical pyrimidine nucleotidase
MTAVLFDLDDTLFDHQHCTVTALAVLRARHDALAVWSVDDLIGHHRELLERLHLEVLDGRLTVDDARMKRFSALFAMAGRRLSSDETAGVAAEYRDAYLASWRLVPGAIEVLTALRPHARLGVVTNNVVGEQTRKLNKLGLAPLFDAVVISEAVGVSKPHARIFAIALERLGSSAADAVMVGDAWGTDVTGARRAGLRAVWFNPAGRPRPGTADVVELASFVPAGHAASVILGTLTQERS